MMKNKTVKQEEEGSTQSNASRYDLLSFFLPFLTSDLIVYLVKHGCSPVHVFNGRFLPFTSIFDQ
uniref:Uncharacterized protein n=1 Tax=Anguilla anguilla TaxID=7936 RepID=A0A0E9XLJ0_ANGAN